MNSKIIFKSSITILLCLFIISNLNSQFTVSGEITDEKTGEALSFANIKCNDKISVSDINGKFNFETNDQNVIFEISYIGYIVLIDSFKLEKGINELGIFKMAEDTKSLSEVTITSGKFKRSIEEVTVSMESLKPEFVEKNNTIRFDDLLEKIPGVSYVDGQANIRGGSGFSYGAGSRVLVLYDNIPALQFDSAFPNWSNIPTETIEKVEVMKGAGSALYGSSAMNGVINILSKYAKKEPYFRYKTHFATYDSPKDPMKKWWTGQNPFKYGITSVYAGKIKKLDVVASVFLEDEPMNYKKDCYNQIGRVTTKLDYHINDALTIGLHANLNAESKVTFYYWSNDTIGAYIGDKEAYSYQAKKVAIVDPIITYIGKKGIKHTLQSRIYYVSNFVDDNKSNYSTSGYGEYQFQKNFSNIDLVVTAGAEHTRSRTDAELYGDTIFVASNTGIYLQAEKKFFDRLNLAFGARYEINVVRGPKVIEGENIEDKYKTESKPIFRFGANYKLFDFTFLRASWGQGFRYPAIAEKFTNAISGNILVLPNPELESETGFTAELGLRQGYKLFELKGFMDFSVFQSEYDNMIEFNIKYKNRLYFAAENIGNTIIKGYEISTGCFGNFKNINFSLIAGYLNVDPKYKEFTEEIERTLSVDYNVLKYRYRHSFRFDFDLNWKKFNLGIGSSYNSFMEAVDKILEQDIFIKGSKKYRQEHMYGTNVYRFRMGYSYNEYDFMFNIDNLFNAEYSVRPGLLEAPRSFTFSLTYTLGK